MSKKAPCTYPGCDRTYTSFAGRRTTLCKACAAAAVARDPARNAKIRRWMKTLLANPEARRDRLAASVAGHHRRIAEDAAYRSQMQAQGRRVGRQANGRWFSQVPLEYRPLYLALGEKLLAPERLALIQDQMHHDQRRFERTGVLPVTGGMP